MNYQEKADFSVPVFVIDGFAGAVTETTLENLCRSVMEQVETPHGKQAVFQVYGSALCSWRTGKKAIPLVEFETTEEAEHAMLLLLRHELFERSDIEFFYDRQEAEQELMNIKTGLAD